MELNTVTTGIELLGTSVRNIRIDNNIIDLKKGAKRNFGLNIHEPFFEKHEHEYYSEMIIDFEMEIVQSEETFRMNITVEGAFCSDHDVDEETFRQLVGVNGAAAIIGIARGKIEAITANVFNNGKVVIPFVNVIDYYKSI